MPEDFDDEEIDEDEAFGPEDYDKYGDVGTSRKRKRGALAMIPWRLLLLLLLRRN